MINDQEVHILSQLSLPINYNDEKSKEIKSSQPENTKKRKRENIEFETPPPHKKRRISIERLRPLSEKQPPERNSLHEDTNQSIYSTNGYQQR